MYTSHVRPPSSTGILMAETQTASIDVACTVEEIFAIVTDVESYPDWAPDIKEVEILEETADGNPARATMVVDAKVKTVRYTLAYEYDYPEEVRWVSEPGGDIKQIDGSYKFTENDDDTTRVDYELTIDLGFPLPGFMMRTATKAIMSTALDGLKGVAEA